MVLGCRLETWVCVGPCVEASDEQRVTTVVLCVCVSLQETSDNCVVCWENPINTCLMECMQCVACGLCDAFSPNVVATRRLLT